MKLQLVSDLHTEFYDHPLSMLKHLEFSPDLDILLLPGDITVPAVRGEKKTREVLEYLSGKARTVLFTTGNHEYYRGRRETVHALLEAILPKNFVWLQNTEATVEGQHFFGGTMWFPDAPHNRMYEDQLSDFLVIREFKTWVYEENRRFNDAARRLVTDKTIVLTHHIPAYRVVAPVFQGDSLNRFFVSEMTDLILSRKPPLWVYGHTHLPGDSVIGETRVVCHPYGYPTERPHLPSYAPEVFEI
jgi:predicted phosphohydrolase